MRTYSRADFLAAREAWADFSPEWLFYQQIAADRGMLYPPSGSKWDSWEDAEPSQRAIIFRAIEDTPRALTDVIRQSRSWHEVVRKLMADLERRREDADYAEKDAEWGRQDEPTPRQAVQAVADILGRIKDSAA